MGTFIREVTDYYAGFCFVSRPKTSDCSKCSVQNILNEPIQFKVRISGLLYRNGKQRNYVGQNFGASALTCTKKFTQRYILKTSELKTF